MPAKRPRALKKGTITCKLARASLKRLTGPVITELGADGKQLMRVWRVVSHVPAGMDSPPALHCIAPSKSRTKRTL
eukprot:656086-Pelagomonas_calceolata.AAC.12